VRRYPAIEVTWPRRPSDGEIDRLLFDLDDGSLSAVEDAGLAWRAFFDRPEARDGALAKLGTLPPGWQARSIDVDDEGWAERSQAAIGAVRVGQLIIAPPWNAPSKPQDGGASHVIVINPSMGFGTGHHASTRLCLSLLQSIPLQGLTVMDVGTGSGVLAVAASALGARAVDAIDNDPDALASAGENVQANGAAATVRLMEAGLSTVDRRDAGYDVMLANLTGATLSREASTLARLGHPGTRLVVSGIEQDEAADVIASLTKAGWQLESRMDEDGWVGLELSLGATSPSGSTGS